MSINIILEDKFSLKNLALFFTKKLFKQLILKLNFALIN